MQQFTNKICTLKNSNFIGDIILLLDTRSLPIGQDKNKTNRYHIFFRVVRKTAAKS